jgi:hypothetical protein
MKKLLFALIFISCTSDPDLYEKHIYQSRNSFQEFPNGSIEIFTWNDLSDATLLLISPKDILGASVALKDTIWIYGVQFQNYTDDMAYFRYWCIKVDDPDVSEWVQYSIHVIDIENTKGKFLYDRRFEIEIH